jgi:hypothetical protein
MGILIVVLGLIGLCMLAVAAFLLLRGIKETNRLVVGIILLVLGLLLICAPTSLFLFLMRFQ